MSINSNALLVGLHVLASLSGWIQFGMALGQGEPRVACLAFAFGCYASALAGATIGKDDTPK
jgi:hypothetical protein